MRDGTDNIRRRTHRRLGLVVGTLGLLVVGTMLGVIGDEDATVPGFVIGTSMVLFGAWSVARSQRIGTPRE